MPVSVTALPSSLMPAAVEKTGTWERNLCLLQIRCCLWSKDAVISEFIFSAGLSFLFSAFPKVASGHGGRWGLPLCCPQLVSPPGWAGPASGWCVLGTTGPIWPRACHGSHSFWPSMPVAINDSCLPPKASAGSEASQQIGIPSLCLAGSPGHHTTFQGSSLSPPPTASSALFPKYLLGAAT